MMVKALPDMSTREIAKVAGGRPMNDADPAEVRALAEASEQTRGPSILQPSIEPAPGQLPGEGSLWIRCKAYRAHQLHHRRDPATGAWRCYLCQPQAVDR